MWVDKYAPKAPEQLAVHVNKVKEVRSWLEGYLAYSRSGARAWVLLVTGECGAVWALWAR